MLEFGVNFLTFKPLEADVLVALADTIKNPWDEPVDQETGDAEFSEAEATVPAALLNRIGHRPPPEGGESAQDMETETQTALATILSNSGAGSFEAGRQPAAAKEREHEQDSGAPTSSAKKRKRKSGSSSSAGRRAGKTAKSQSQVLDSGELKQIARSHGWL